MVKTAPLIVSALMVAGCAGTMRHEKCARVELHPLGREHSLPRPGEWTQCIVTHRPTGCHTTTLRHTYYGELVREYLFGTWSCPAGATAPRGFFRPYMTATDEEEILIQAPTRKR